MSAVSYDNSVLVGYVARVACMYDCTYNILGSWMVAHFHGRLPTPNPPPPPPPPPSVHPSTWTWNLLLVGTWMIWLGFYKLGCTAFRGFNGCWDWAAGGMVSEGRLAVAVAVAVQCSAVQEEEEAGDRLQWTSNSKDLSDGRRGLT